MKKLKSMIFAFVSIVMGCQIALIIAEGYLRINGPWWLAQRMSEIGVSNETGINSDDLWSDENWPIERFRDNQFLRFKPGSKFTAGHYEFKNTVNIDEWGGRVTTFSTSSDKNGVVPFMGDSFAFGLGVEDHETYVSLLGESSGNRILNLGYPGSSLPEQLDIIEHRHDDFSRPKKYVFNFFTGNDYTNILKYHTKKNGGGHALQPRRTFLTIMTEKFNDFINHNPLTRHSHLVQFIKAKALYYYNQRKQTLGDPYRMGEYVFYVIYPDEKLNKMRFLLEENVKRLKNMSEQLGFESHFIIIPDRIQINEDLLHAKAEYYGLDPKSLDPALPNRILHHILDKYQIPYIDTTACLKKQSRHLRAPIYYELDTHLTPLGHRIVSYCIETHQPVHREDILKRTSS